MSQSSARLVVNFTVMGQNLESSAKEFAPDSCILIEGSQGPPEVRLFIRQWIPTLKEFRSRFSTRVERCLSSCQAHRHFSMFQQTLERAVCSFVCKYVEKEGDDDDSKGVGHSCQVPFP